MKEKERKYNRKRKKKRKKDKRKTEVIMKIERTIVKKESELMKGK